jgi:hypothetical protein
MGSTIAMPRAKLACGAMTPRRRIVIGIALMCILLGPPCEAAGANPLTRVEKAYASGGISPCKFSAKELNAALSEIPGDVAQYDADLIDAIHQALAYRPTVACNGASEAGSGLPSLRGSGGGPSVSVPARPVGAATESGVPAPLLILAMLISLWAVSAAVWGAARLLGIDPRWAARAGHAVREAGYRMAQRWTGITARMRVGR